MTFNKATIQTEYAALVEIVRVVRAAGEVNADQMYAPYAKEFPREDFNRIVHVLERCKQIKMQDGKLIWQRRVN